ncbi:solute carrier family 25 member 16-like [Frankliniella occidentalis]|uniref:Solute carrier family 25 member 16-like n=1 Tax=Frankliniella occidentalis TaxID=133901 RepID=A0A6J1TJS3_FRAOC|nr:solute carrier family 25 member 16-like [Frankliniella occidentalis]
MSSSNQDQYKTLLSGGIAGMCSKTTVAPLDRIKILFQAHNSHYKNLGVWSGLNAIRKNEGFMALYKGNGAQMVRIFPYAAIQFTAFEQYKKTFKSFLGTDTVLGAFAVKFGAGACAGTTAVTATYPLDTVRARLAFQVKGEHKYKGIIDAFKTIYKSEGGLLALYRGFIPTLCGIFPYAGCSFYSFETLKNLCMLYLPSYTCETCAENTGGLVLLLPAKLVCGGFAGAVAQIVSYPLDVTRRRMQLAMMDQETAKFAQSMWGTLKMTYKENGIVRGLYRGMSTNFYRAGPMFAVSFSTFELMKQLLGLDTGSS